MNPQSGRNDTPAAGTKASGGISGRVTPTGVPASSLDVPLRPTLRPGSNHREDDSMKASKPRITPLEPKQWNKDVARVLGGTRQKVGELADSAAGPRPLNILMTIAHQPALLEPFIGFAAALALRGLLPRRESELLALRTAWNCQSAFEWGHHVLYAKAAGFDDSQIAAIAVGPSAAEWSASDRVLLRAADELHESKNISDATWQELSASWNSGQLVEIGFVVGNYTMLSMIANSTQVPLEPDLPPLPARQPRSETGRESDSG